MLVIHREEIKKSKTFSALSSIATVVTLSQVSQDDPYMILAALRCGPSCQIVTNDFLRQHYNILCSEDPSLAMLFSKWQVSSQVRIIAFQGYSGKKYKSEVSKADPLFYWPVKHDLVSQCSLPLWHLPVRPSDTINGFYIPETWVCIQQP